MGFENFKALVNDSNFIRAMQNTILLIVVVTMITFALALVFAGILTRENIKGKELLRVIFYIPNILSIVVISGIFSAIYKPENGMLNSLLADATARVQPPTDKGRRLKIYYMTQVGVKPPHFVIFCNDKKLFHFSYQRYLENQIRSVFGLEGTPITITVRQKGEDEN